VLKTKNFCPHYQQMNLSINTVIEIKFKKNLVLIDKKLSKKKKQQHTHV